MPDFPGLVDRLGANPGIGVAAGFIHKELKSPSGNNQGDDKNKAVEESLGIKNVCGSGRKAAAYPKELNKG